MTGRQASARLAVVEALESVARLCREAHELAYTARLSGQLEADVALTAQAFDRYAAALRRTLRGARGRARVWASFYTGAGWVEVRCFASDVAELHSRFPGGDDWAVA